MSHRDDLRNIEDVLDEGQDGSECMICGRTKANHHDFERRQRGCVCEAGGWEGADFVEFICRTFIASQFDPDRCATCEHDKACHQQEPKAIPKLPHPATVEACAREADAVAGEFNERIDDSNFDDYDGAEEGPSPRATGKGGR